MNSELWKVMFELYHTEEVNESDLNLIATNLIDETDKMVCKNILNSAHITPGWEIINESCKHIISCGKISRDRIMVKGKYDDLVTELKKENNLGPSDDFVDIVKSTREGYFYPLLDEYIVKTGNRLEVNPKFEINYNICYNFNHIFSVVREWNFPKDFRVYVHKNDKKPFLIMRTENECAVVAPRMEDDK